MSETLDWRPILAALANPEVRRIAGLLMSGADAAAAFEELSPSRRKHVRDALLRSGIVAAQGDDLAFVDDAFARALQNAAPPARPTGVQRFLRDGRIDRYPSRPGERQELLEHVAAHVIEHGEVIGERALNERLLAFSDDIAVLRRYLVDFGIVERRADGSEYALVSA